MVTVIIRQIMYLYAKDCKELYCSESCRMQDTWTGRKGRRSVIPSAETGRVAFQTVLLPVEYILSVVSLNMYFLQAKEISGSSLPTAWVSTAENG